MALNLVSNYAANVAHRNLTGTDRMATSSLAKLSSGTRVVSAKDDAASLAIGSRLNAEVQAMRQANVNAGQAGSMLQIADGAYGTISDILVRMKSLAVQSSSGQLSSTERSVLNTEFTNLRSEIDRIASDTEFNGVSLISGSNINEITSTSALSQFGITKVSFDTSVHSADDNIYRIEYNGTSKELTAVKLDGSGPGTQSVTLTSAQQAAITALTGSDTLDINIGNGISITVNSTFNHATDILEDVNDNVNAASTAITAFTAGTLSFANTGITDTEHAALLALTSLDANGAGYNAQTGVLRMAVTSTTTANEINIMALAGVNFGAGAGVVSGALTSADTLTVSIGSVELATLALTTVTSTNTAEANGYIDINIGQLMLRNDYTASGGSTSFSFKIGTGVETYDSLSFSLSSASTTALGVSSSTIDSVVNANSASTAVSTAINTLNTSRATVGAAQNRLTFASGNLATAVENAEAARSQLLDLDVASEMSQFTGKQVLMQAGVSMLAQANQMPQNLLRLFQ